MKRTWLMAPLALAMLAGSCGKHEVLVSGLVVDPEQFLYARLGILARALGTTDTGPCWDAPCSGSEAVALTTIDATIVALENEGVASDPAPGKGEFSITAERDAFLHFVATPVPATYLPTIDGVGTLCSPDPAADTDTVAGVVLHGCGTYGMMQLVSDYMDTGVVSVVVMDDGGVPELLPVMEPDNIEVTVTGGDPLYWVFNPNDPVNATDPVWGWQPLVSDVADVPAGMVWIGMVSIVNPTGDTVTIEVTDSGSGPGRPFSYDPLAVPVRPSHYTYCEALPTN